MKLPDKECPAVISFNEEETCGVCQKKFNTKRTLFVYQLDVEIEKYYVVCESCLGQAIAIFLGEKGNTMDRNIATIIINSKVKFLEEAFLSVVQTPATLVPAYANLYKEIEAKHKESKQGNSRSNKE